jgi:desulfoferrodoxin-like iron-binding protein
MKHRWILAMVVVFLATGFAVMSAGSAQYGSQAAQEYTQEKPYTATFFGPWNEAVAKTHVPQVTCEKTAKGYTVTVQIDNHPMDPQKPHWIMWIRLENEKGVKLVEKEFKATDPGPAKAVFEISPKESKFRALERCNIHGIWLNEVNAAAK